ncbi:ABC transporter permease [Micromonospora sp. NPDC005113]
MATETTVETVPARAGSPPAARTLAARDRARRWLGSLALLVIVLGVWEGVVWFALVDPVILPRPVDVVTALGSLLTTSYFWHNLWVTTSEVLLGFVFGVLIGCALGALLATTRWLREITYPYVVAFSGLPKVVLAPLFITAFGFGITSKVVMAVTICFFALLVNTELGLTSVDREAVQLMKSLNASRRDIFMKLSVPHALPLVFAGMKTGLSLALVGAIVGEFVGASAGLGYLLNQYSYQLDVPRVWAITLVLAAMGVLLFVIIEQVDRRVVFWNRPSRTATES